MKKTLIAIPAFFLLIFAPVALAQSNFRSNEVATLEKGEVIDADYFSSGEKVTLSGTVNGDAYLAGGNIFVDGVVNGDLLVAGGNINVTGQVTGNIRAAGGNIQIDGEVGRNVTTAGGNIRVDNDANIGGSMVVGAGNAEIFGPIARGLTAGVGALTLNNSVGSNVTAGVGQLDLRSGTNVNGDLVYFSDQEATLSPEASVSGRITHNFPPRDQGRDEFIAGLNTGWNLFSLLSSLLVGLLLALAFPNFTSKAAALVLERPWILLGVGFLILVLTPILILILFVTLIGIPLAILLLVAYIFLVLFAKVFAALAIGQRVLGALNQKASQIWALIFGLLLLAVLGFIPIIGGLISFVVTLIGLGAYFLTKKTYWTELRSKKIL